MPKTEKFLKPILKKKPKEHSKKNKNVGKSKRGRLEKTVSDDGRGPKRVNHGKSS